MKIPDYIRIFNYPKKNTAKIRVYKEKNTNKIGILDYEKNVIKIKNFARKQDIDFKQSEYINVEIIYKDSLKSRILYFIKLLTLHFSKMKKINIPFFCDSFILNNNGYNEEDYIIPNEISENSKNYFKYFQYMNGDDSINEKYNYGEKPTHKNKSIGNFLKKINEFQESLPSDSEEMENKVENFVEENINKKSEKSKNRNKKNKNKKKIKKINKLKKKKEKCKNFKTEKKKSKASEISKGGLID